MSISNLRTLPRGFAMAKGFILGLLLAIGAALFLMACPTETDDGHLVLNIQIDKDNDSLLTYDTLIIKVYSKDSSFVQEVFHGKLDDPKKVMGIQLDPRVGKEFRVSIVGYKSGQLAMHKEITVIDRKNPVVKDLPVKDTIIIDPGIPEILAPGETIASEGDSLAIRIEVRNPWSGQTTFALKNGPSGSRLDTSGQGLGAGIFRWKPDANQGRADAYPVTIVYSSSDRQVEKTISVRIRNVNRPPKLTPIADQKGKEGETLTIKPEASDPDGDSLTLKATSLPSGAEFAAGLFTWKPALGQKGNHSVRFTVTDGQDSDWVAVLVTVGNVDLPPSLSLEITYPGRDTTVNISKITVRYSVNNQPKQREFSLKDGRNKISIDTTVAGRTAFDTVVITMDTLSPAAPKVSGASPINTRTPTWTWSGAGGGNGIFRFRVDNEDMASASVTQEASHTPLKDLEPGAHTLFVQERDDAGNWSLSSRHTIRIDTTRPPAPSVTVTPASPTNDSRPVWKWTVTGDDIAGIYRFKLNDQDFRTGASESQTPSFQPKIENALKEGPAILYVQQRDSAGNWSASGSATVVIDLSPPGASKVTSNQTSPTRIAKPEWTWTSGGGGSGYFRFKLNDSVFAASQIGIAKLSFIPDSALKEGRHVLYVQERDTAGNWSQTGSYALTLDLTPPGAPQIDAKQRQPLSTLKPTWTWKSGGGGEGLFRVRLVDTNWSAGFDTTRTGSHQPGTLAEGPQTLHVQERDPAGNWSRSSSQTLVLAVRGPLGPEAFSVGSASSTTLALHGSVPYIAFQDGSNGGKATVMRFNGTTWELVGMAGFSDGEAIGITLAVSEAGVPHVAFSDGADANKAKVLRYRGGLWEKVGPQASNGGVSYITLRLNGSIPYLAYRDDAIGSMASVARFNGSIWEPIGKSGFSPAFIGSVSMDLDKNAVPYVVWTSTDSLPSLAVRKFGGTNWDPVAAPKFGPNEAYRPVITLDGNNVPYVAYANGDKNFSVEVRKLEGGAWVNVAEASSTLSRGMEFSLALGAGGIPYVALQDGSKDEKLTVVRLSGKTWETLGTAGFTSAQVSAVSMALTPAGIPYIGFSDRGNAYKATVVKASFDP